MEFIDREFVIIIAAVSLLVVFVVIGVAVIFLVETGPVARGLRNAKNAIAINAVNIIKPMKWIERPDGTKAIRLNSIGNLAVNNALLLSVEFIEDWEYQTRIGVTTNQAESLLDRIHVTDPSWVKETELTTVCNVLNFSLEHIEDWEFHTLVGLTKKDVRLILGKLTRLSRERGRTAFLDKRTRTIVTKAPSAVSGETVFRPRNPDRFFRKLK